MDRWDYYGERMDEGMQQMSTDEEEVIKLCKDISIYKSSGIDGLSSRICKDAFLVLSYQLTYLLNCSLSFVHLQRLLTFVKCSTQWTLQF